MKEKNMCSSKKQWEKLKNNQVHANWGSFKSTLLALNQQFDLY